MTTRFDAFPRWEIKATLRTASPLHIGSGEDATLGRRRDGTSVPRLVVGGEREIRVSGVCKDYRGYPCIPATSLRGAWGSFLTARFLTARDRDLAARLFGSTKGSGRIEVRNAYLAELPRDASFANTEPYWSEATLTAVATSVAIDDLTRTAADDKLFHVEYVPEGVSFEFRVLCHGIDAPDIQTLHGALRAMLQEGIGAETANSWGHLEITKWTAWEQTKPGLAAVEFTGAFTDPPTGPVNLTLSLPLAFEGGFLVNEPSRAKTRDETPGAHEPGSNHAPRLARDGGAALPTKSFRGAFKAQAKRILRTVHDDWAACTSDSPCKAEKVDSLCPACQLFGATKWGSTVSLDIVRASKAPPTAPVSQEFCAIDRFTGAVASKFNASGAWQPSFVATVTLDWRRIENAGIASWAYGLIALTIRDLAEGDITFGWGKGKDYGAIETFNPEELFETFKEMGIDLEAQVKALNALSQKEARA